MKSLFVPIALLALSATVFLFSCARSGRTTEERAPRIVNLINFVRNTEPRPVNISDEELYRTTLAQTELLRRHGLKGTFLLQYDALINPKYQALMKQALAEGSEVGGWWEITQPHVEAAGMEWRGVYPWDWHANVGFSSGYEPQEREKLVDTYMAKFKEVFGRYPASVGSWFIDARTLQYMADRYGIVASCNCRDQVGTDGYTLWGGYWNQGYYPSKLNAYMPAQTRDGQIGVPVFRMLGSDPINQYDSGIGEPAQGVETLEPVYESGGGNPRWIDWFFGMMTEGECLAYQYVQAGQENSFTWPRMQCGLEYQVRVIDSLSRAGKLTVQTLAETGRWFRERFETTPPTSVVALSDCKEAGRGSVWYDCRNYRANPVWENGTFRFRDIHLFDQRLESDYLNEANPSTQCFYTTLPVVDGLNWSSVRDTAGLRLMFGNLSESPVRARVGEPEVERSAEGELRIAMPLDEGGRCVIRLNERSIRIELPPSAPYRLMLTTARDKRLPFTKIASREIRARIKDFDYGFRCTAGTIESNLQGAVFSVSPDGEGAIELEMATGR